jgi:BirA family transcriptional regulator, biotin operon repressor / biotin---[acetyl-CoA-carboxylase] ligase
MPGDRFSDVRHFESIDSTNRYLIDEARAGAPQGLVAVADYQTAGRGRQGRTWTAPPGSNLLASVLLRPLLPPPQRPLALAAVALAARDAVHDAVGIALGVKWPNDLVAPDGRKVAGALAEADTDTSVGDHTAHGDGPAVVVGIGINCNWPTDDDLVADDLVDDDAVLAGAVSLRQLSGQPIDRARLLTGLLGHLGSRVDQLEDPSGRAVLRADLRAATITLGRLVRVELTDRTIEGAASDLTDEGHLVVVTAHGPETVVTGDVVHLRERRDVAQSEGVEGAQG